MKASLERGESPVVVIAHTGEARTERRINELILERTGVSATQTAAERAESGSARRNMRREMIALLQSGDLDGLDFSPR